jgi:UDP-N-acetylmuramate--alanine ligase
MMGLLRLRPEIAVLTNVEDDHPDFYGTSEQVYDAFRQFAHGITDRLVYCADDPIAGGIARRYPRPLSAMVSIPGSGKRAD